LPFFEPLPVSLIPPIKGVSCFTHDAAEEGKIGVDGTMELCVVKRRVVQIYKIGEFLQMKKVSTTTLCNRAQQPFFFVYKGNPIT
jgi:hypothetical protein